MAAAAGRSYRIVHYAPRQRVFMRTVRLQWSWDWRYSRDPVVECRAAVECRQTLMDRARQITDEINGQISRGDVPAGRRFALVDTQDSIDGPTRHAIWQDLINVQLTIATLSALSVKSSLESLPDQGRESAA
ncbi:MAG: hypothetical protein ACJ8B6_02515 [Gemmatimonadales bacterium]